MKRIHSSMRRSRRATLCSLGALFSILLLGGARPARAAVSEGFESIAFSTTSYASSTASGWRINSGMASTTARTGSRAARLASTGGANYLQYENTDANGKDGGVGTISFWYRSWGTSAVADFKVQANINGAGFTDIGSAVVNAPVTYTQWTYDLNNSSDNIIIKVIETTANERLLIDDFSIADYAPSCAERWTCLDNRGTPVYSYYLGDYLAYIFYYELNIDTTGWTSDYGLGTTTGGSGWTWRSATYDSNNGSNWKWKNNASQHQFTSVGNWYYAGRFVNGSCTYYADADWKATSGSALAAASYFTVNAINETGSRSATTASSSQINLSWTKNAQSHNVMVVRKTSAQSWTEPTQGTGYSAGNSIGSGVVVYNGSDTSYNNTGLSSGTAYDYKFYSVNNNYYSSGQTASATTWSLPTLTSPTATSIGQTTATLGATVTANGGTALTSRGTVWGTATSPTGNAVAEGGTAVSAFTHGRTGLTQGTKIFYRGYAVNSVGTAYSPEGTFYTEPGQASGVQFASVAGTTMTISWTAAGDSDGSIVVVRAGNSTVTDPTDGTLHSASAAFGSGDNLGSTGSYVVYRGSGTSVDVTGLTEGTTYYVEVFAYKGTVADSGVNQGINYRQTSPATGNAATCATPAAPVATAAGNVGSGSFSANWNAASGAAGYRLDVMSSLGSGGASLISENIQSWTAQGSYGNYQQSISAGTVNMTQCIIQPSASASGVGSVGRVQMQQTTGILALPSLNTVGTITMNIAAGGSGRGATLQRYVGGTWTDLTTWSDIGTTGAAFTYDLNSSDSGIQLRLATPTAGAIYVHDISVTSYGTPTYVSGYQNLNVNNVVTYAVSGLDPLTTYYYRVRAYSGNCTSENSNTITVNTTAAAATVALADNGTQTGAANVAAGTSSQVLHKFKLAVGAAQTTLTALQITTAGHDADDLTNLKLWYSTDDAFGGDTTIGTISSPGTAGTKNFTSMTKDLAVGVHYFFITADIASTATAGNSASVGAIANTAITVTSGNKSGGPTTAGGAQTFTSAVTISNAGTPAAGSIAAGTANAVLFGFQISPATGSIDFTGVTITKAGDATSSDYSNFEVVYDANGNGAYDSGTESVVSDTKAIGATIVFAISGQTGISAARKYLVIADASATATAGRTFTGSIAAAGNATTTGDETGTASGYQQTISVGVAISNTGTPAAGNVAAGTANKVLFGFQLVVSGTVDFTGVTITKAGDATSSDLSNFEVVYDANGNGAYDSGTESVVSDAKAIGATIAFAMSGQTGITGTRKYLVIADASATATAGRTFTGSIAAAGNVTTTGDETGTAAGNQQTISVGVAISNTGTPAAGNVTPGTSDKVLFGFQLVISGTVDFSGLTLTAAGTANSSDYSNFEVIYDANGNGAYDSGTESVVSDTKAFGSTIAFTMSGQTGITGTRKYLVIADAASAALAGATFTGSIANSADVNTTGTESGTAAGNQQTLTGAVSIDNTGTPAAGNISGGATDAVLFGFRLSPSSGSVTFNGLTLTTAGTATSSDYANFEVVYDADNSSTYNTGDSIVSSSAQSLANPIFFTITGQTRIGSARRYLIIADVQSGATSGRTFTGSIAAAGNVDTTGTETGTAAGNQMTLSISCVPDKVSLAQRVAYYTTWGSTGGAFDDGSDRVGQWGQGSGGQTVAWRNFKTDGSGGGANRELQPGDRFKISVEGWSPAGYLGCSLNDGAATGSWANRINNARGYVEATAYGDMAAFYNGGSTTLGAKPWNSTVTLVFDVLSTKEFTARIEGAGTPKYDAAMLNSPADTDRIDGYSIYYSDDWADGARRNAYWKPETSVTNLGYVEFGADGGTRTINGKITDGTNPKCPDTPSPNYLKKSGSGTITLGNSGSTYTLYTEIAGGTLQISADGCLGTAPVGTSAQHLRMANGTTLVGTDNFTLDAKRGISLTGGNVYLAVADNKAVTYNGTINDGANNYGIIKNQGGELILGGANTIDGSVYIDNGRLTLNHANAAGTGGIYVGTYVGNYAATLNLGAAVAVANNVTVGTGTTGSETLAATETATLSGSITINETYDDRVYVDVASGKTLTLGGVMSGTGGGKITKTGAGTLVLSNAGNSHDKKVQINAGTVSISASRNLGADPGGAYANKLTLNGGTLKATASFTMHQYNSTTLGVNNGFIDADSGVTLTYPAAISGSGAFGKTGTGILKLTGANTFSGPVTNTTGTLQIGDNGTAGSLTANIVNNAALIWHWSGNPSYSGAISGTGTLEKKGAGTLALSGNNSYSGATTISEGAVSVSHANALGTAAGNTTVANGAQLRLSGAGTGDALVLTGVGPDSKGALYNAGGANAVSGAITLGGATRINSDSAVLTLSGGITGAYGLTFGGGSSFAINSVIGNVSAITMDGTGTLTLSSGYTHTFSGTATVSAGTLLNNALASSMAVSVSAGAGLVGTGTNAAVSITGTVDPGATAGGAVGKLTGSSLTLNAGGALRVDVSNVSGTAGVNWDLFAATGNVTVGGAATIQLYGNPTGWDATAGYSWMVVDGGGTTSGEGNLTINTNNFTAATDGGSFSVVKTGNDLFVVYTPRTPAVPVAFDAAAASVSSMTLTFTRNANLDPVVIVYDLDGTFTTPTGTPPAIDSAFAGGTVVYKGGDSPQTHASLAACTPYYYKVWSYKGTNYSVTGLTDNDTTATPAAPATVWASATNETDFTAAWSAATGASGYRLDVSTYADFQIAGSTTITSENFATLTDTAYPSGWTGDRTADLDYVNSPLYGAASPGFKFQTSGQWLQSTTFGTGATNLQFWAYGNGSGTPSTLAVSGLVNSVWTLVDTVSITAGSGVTYNVPLSSQTTQIKFRFTKNGYNVALDDFVIQGNATPTPSYVAGYSNLTVAGTSQLVSGLTAGQTYHFRVRTHGAGGCDGANSSTASVMTVIVPSIALADNGTQVAAANVLAGATAQVLHKFQLGVTVAATELSGVSFTTPSGYAAADVAKFQVWYSADSSFATTGDNVQLGSDIVTSLGPGTHAVSGLTKALAVGTHYIFITADIAATPTYCDTLGVNGLTTANVTVTVGNKSGSTTASGAQTLIPVEPAAHATLLAFTAVGTTGMTVGWTLPTPAPAGVLVVVKAGTATSWTPTDLAVPAGINANFTTATDQGGGNKVCYSGSGSSVALSGLAANTTYAVTVFEYNGTGTCLNYYTGGTPLAGTQATACLDATASLWASATNLTDFTAAWSSIAGATGYQLDVSTNASFTGGAAQLINEGFSGGTTPPAGWTFTGITGIYDTSGNYGAASPSVRFDDSNDRIQTAGFANPTNVTFWIKGQSTDSSSALLVESAAGGSWSTVANVVPLPTTGTTKSYALGTSVTNLRFTYTKSVGNLSFDDVKVNGPSTAFVVGYESKPVTSGTSQQVTGLTEGMTYYFRVRGTNATCVGGNSATASVVLPSRPGIAVYPATLEPSTTVGSNPASGQFCVTNVGGYELSYVVTTSYLASAAAGLRNQALAFDGNGDYVQYAPVPVVGELSVEAWINPSTGMSAAGSIIHKDYDYSLYVNSDMTVSWANNNGGWSFATFGYHNIGLVKGVWQHLAVTKDASGLVKIYLNGVEKVSKANGGAMAANNANATYVGRYNATYFNGQIDDVRVWNAVRTPQQIANNMNAELTGTETGLTAYWKFNEGTGSAAADSTASAYNGTVYNAVWTGPKWISGVAPSTGSGLAAGAGQCHTVSYDVTGLNPGIYTAQVVVTSTGTGNNAATNSPQTNVVVLTVGALPNPTIANATVDGNTLVRLAWTKHASYDVMIVYRAGGPSGAPAQGVAYTNGAPCGGGTVIYKGAGSTLDHVVNSGATHYYAFYSVNNNGYSSGLTDYDSTGSFGSGEIVDTFSYTNGTSLATFGAGSNGWSGAWSGDTASFTSSNGSFAACANYPEPTGNKLKVSPAGGTTKAVTRTFDWISTKIYVSFYMNFYYGGHSAGQEKWCGVKLMENGTERVFCGESGSGDQVLGLHSSTYAKSILAGANQDYIVVLKYDIANDSAHAWVYKVGTDTVPTSEPGTWDAEFNNVNGGGGGWSINGVRLVSGGNGSATPGDTYFDELRVGTSWDKVIISDSTPPTLASAGMGGELFRVIASGQAIAPTSGSGTTNVYYSVPDNVFGAAGDAGRSGSLKNPGFDASALGWSRTVGNNVAEWHAVAGDLAGGAAGGLLFNAWDNSTAAFGEYLQDVAATSGAQVAFSALMRQDQDFTTTFFGLKMQFVNANGDLLDIAGANDGSQMMKSTTGINTTTQRIAVAATAPAGTDRVRLLIMMRDPPGPGTGGSQTPLANPNFDGASGASINGWTRQSDAGSIAWGDGNAGSQAGGSGAGLKFNAYTPGGSGGFYQDADCSPNDSVTFQIRMRQNFTEGTGFFGTRLQFLDSGGNVIGPTTYSSTEGVGTESKLVSVTATAPGNAAKVRCIVRMEGAPTPKVDNAFGYADEATLTGAITAGGGVSRFGYVDNCQLAGAGEQGSGAATLALVFGANDPESGLSRGVDSAATRCNVDVANPFQTWKTDDVGGYNASFSSAESKSTASTSVWYWTGLANTDFAKLLTENYANTNNGAAYRPDGRVCATNRVAVSLVNGANQWVNNQQYGYLAIQDDDVQGPTPTLLYVGTNVLVDTFSEANPKITVTDQEMLGGGVDVAYQWYDPSGVFLVNTNGATNEFEELGGLMANVCPNFDLTNATYGSHGHDVLHTPATLIGTNGATVVTARWVNLLIPNIAKTNIPLHEDWTFTVSAQDADNDRGSFASLAAVGKTDPYVSQDRTAAINVPLTFRILDDDTSPPVAGSATVTEKTDGAMRAGNWQLTVPMRDDGSGLSKGTGNAMSSWDPSPFLSLYSPSNYPVLLNRVFDNWNDITNGTSGKNHYFPLTVAVPAVPYADVVLGAHTVAVTVADYDDDRYNAANTECIDREFALNTNAASFNVNDDDGVEPEIISLTVDGVGGDGSSNLLAGAIAIIGVNGASAGDSSQTNLTHESFSFVVLAPFPAGTTLWFTDCGWNANTDTNWWDTNEFHLASWTSTGPGDIGSTFKLALPDINGGGDQVALYQYKGTGNPKTDPTNCTFIYAINIDGTKAGYPGWYAGAPPATPDNEFSGLYHGLTEGWSALSVTSSTVNVYYSGGTTGTASWLLQQISNPTNWATGLAAGTDYDFINNYIPPFKVTGQGFMSWTVPKISDEQMYKGGYRVTNVVQDIGSGLVATDITCGNGAVASAPYYVLYNTNGAVAVSNKFDITYANGYNAGPATNVVNALGGNYNTITLGMVDFLVAVADTDDDRPGDTLYSTNVLQVEVYDDDSDAPTVALTNIQGHGSSDYVGTGEILYYDFGTDTANPNLQPTRANAAISSVANVAVNNGTLGGIGGDTGQGAAITSSSWTNTLPAYWQFAITLQPGYALDVTSFMFAHRRSSTGPINWALRSSKDSYAGDLAAGTMTDDDNWHTVAVNPTSSSNNGPVTYRLYAWNAEANAGTWRIDNVYMTGKVYAVTSGGYVATDSDLNTNGVVFWAGVQDAFSGVCGLEHATRYPSYDLVSPVGVASNFLRFGKGPANEGAKALTNMVATNGFGYNDIVLGVYTARVRAADYDDDRVNDTLYATNEVALAVVDDDAQGPLFSVQIGTYVSFDNKSAGSEANGVTDGDLVNGLSISNRLYDEKSGILSTSVQFRVQSPDGWDSGRVDFTTRPPNGGSRTNQFIDAGTTTVFVANYDVKLNDLINGVDGRALGVWTTTFYAVDYDNDRPGDGLATNVAFDMFVIDDDKTGPRMTNVVATGVATPALIATGFEPVDGWTDYGGGSNWTHVANDGSWTAISTYINTTYGRGPEGIRAGYHAGFNDAGDSLQLPALNQPGWLTVWARNSGETGAAQWVLEQWSGSQWNILETAKPVAGTSYQFFSWLVDSTNANVQLRLRMTALDGSIYFDDLVVTPYRPWSNVAVDLAWGQSTDFSTLKEYRVVPASLTNNPPTSSSNGVSVALNQSTNFAPSREVQGTVTGYVFAVDADEDRGPRDRAAGIAIPTIARLDVTRPTTVTNLQAKNDLVDDPSAQFDLEWASGGVGPDDPADPNHPTGVGNDVLSPWRTYRIYYAPWDPLDQTEELHGTNYVMQKFISTKDWQTNSAWKSVVHTNAILDAGAPAYQPNYLALTNPANNHIRLYDLDPGEDYVMVIVGLDKAGNESEPGVYSWATNDTIKFIVTSAWTVAKSTVYQSFASSNLVTLTNVPASSNATALAWIAAGQKQTTNGLVGAVTKVYDLIYWDSNSKFQESSNNDWRLVNNVRSNWFADDGGMFRGRGDLRFYRASYLDRWRTSRMVGTNLVVQRPLASEEVYALHNVVLSREQNFVALHGVPYTNTFRAVFGGTNVFPGGASGFPGGGATLVEFYSSGTNAVTSSQYWLSSQGRWFLMNGSDVTDVGQPTNFFTRGFSITLPNPLPAAYVSTTAFDWNQSGGMTSPIPAMVWSPVLQVPTNHYGFSQTIACGWTTGRVSALVYNLVALRLPVAAHPSQMNLVNSGFVTGPKGFGDEIYTWNTATKTTRSGSTIFCDGSGKWRFVQGEGEVPAGFFRPNDVIVLVSRNWVGNGTWTWTYYPTNFYDIPTRWMGH